VVLLFSDDNSVKQNIDNVQTLLMTVSKQLASNVNCMFLWFSLFCYFFGPSEKIDERAIPCILAYKFHCSRDALKFLSSD